MNIKNLFKSKKIIYIGALVFIVLFSVGYSALSQSLNISGSTRYNKKYPIRVTGIQLQGVSNSGTEQFNPSYTWNTTTTGVNLPQVDSTVTYTVTIRNYSEEERFLSLSILNNSNTNMTYSVDNMPTDNVIPGNSTITINVTILYESTLPEETTGAITIKYRFAQEGAMFKTGKEVSAKAKQFVKSTATYNSADTTITKILRYIDTPDPTYLIEENNVSIDDFTQPIYMWYDSVNTTIYWYTEATDIYYNYDASYHYHGYYKLTELGNMDDISSKYTTDMNNMFSHVAWSSPSLDLSLGNSFDTSNVTNMQAMFMYVGACSTHLTVNLGDKFDTSKVTNMRSMFEELGRDVTDFTFSLGDKFDTSNVTDMKYMLFRIGKESTIFTLDLGDKFDTSNVTDMTLMLAQIGKKNTSFTLDLGDKFDTSNVTTMYGMFDNTGYNSTIFTLDLGDKFDTRNVTNMNGMFDSVGYSSTIFTLDLGDKFDTSNVTDMREMFRNIGLSTSNFELDLGEKFDTSKVKYMGDMFKGASTLKTVYVNNLFVTTAVTSSTDMFNSCNNIVGGQGTVFNSSYIDKTYAHIDGGTSNPGYFTARTTATFKSGQEVNAKMKQFVNSSATYNTTDTTITNMARYTGTPNSSDLIDANKVSTTDSQYPIYMWYDSTNTTIYWYTEANQIYYNENSSYFYSNLRAINSIPNLNDINSKKVTNMSNMFGYTGYSSTNFTLDLGDKFDTSKVTDMSSMFEDTGHNSTVFTLNLGDKFDTSNITIKKLNEVLDSIEQVSVKKGSKKA